VQGYNTQVAVEPTLQLIVGQTVTQAANDKQQMVPLIEAIQEQSRQKTGRSPGRQWVLLRGKSKVLGEKKDGRDHRDRKAETGRTEGALQTGPVTERSQSRRADET